MLLFGGSVSVTTFLHNRLFCSNLWSALHNFIAAVGEGGNIKNQEELIVFRLNGFLDMQKCKIRLLGNRGDCPCFGQLCNAA